MTEPGASNYLLDLLYEIRKNMECQYCKNACKRDGKQKDGTQKYRCKNCGKYQQKIYKYRAKILKKRNMVVKLLLNNCGFSGISRVLEISENTVVNIVLNTALHLKTPVVKVKGIYEIDEMRAYKKAGKDIWVSYAFERNSGKVLGISAGKRDRFTLRVTINDVLMRSPKRIYTDGYGVYEALIPIEIHKVSKKMLWRIERVHLNARNALKMLNRKTLAFVRKPSTLAACLKLLFWS